MGSRTRVLKIGQNVRQLAQCFHIPVYIYVHIHTRRLELAPKQSTASFRHYKKGKRRGFVITLRSVLCLYL